MKRVALYIAGIAFALFSLCSCATTSNPAEGGFFSGVQGLRSGEYQNRVNQKQSDLGQLKESGSQLRAEQENLSERSADLASRERSYRHRLAHMNRDLARLQARLRKSRINTKSGRAQKVQLEKNLTTLKVRIRTQEHSGGLSEDQIQQQLAGLQQEKSRLEHEILNLTSQ
ncbi:MAG: hypothetical protein P4L43_02680 [Syntrophobacteraceae bacterium]|nr:hypothetical protein [Syntrophobacteraceae bacterium]